MLVSAPDSHLTDQLLSIEPDENITDTVAVMMFMRKMTSFSLGLAYFHLSALSRTPNLMAVTRQWSNLHACT